MIRKIFFLSILFSFSSVQFGQDRIIDSLKELRGEWLKKPASYERDTSVAMLDISIGVKLKKYNFDEAIFFSYDGFKIYTKYYNYKRLAITTHLCGNIYRSQGDYDKALVFINGMKKYCEIMKDSFMLSEAYSVLGNIALNQGNYTESLNYHLMALKYREVLQHKGALSSTYNNLGLIYLGREEYDKAIDYMHKSLAFRKDRAEAEVITNLATAYDYKREFKKAYEYHRRALNYFISINDYNGIANEYNNIGGHYHLQEMRDSLLVNQFKALEYYEKMDDKSGISGSYSNIGAAYLEKGDYTKAEQYLLTSLNTARSLHETEAIMTAYKKLAELYQKKKDYHGAFDNYFYFAQTKDSMEAISNSRVVGQLETKFENDKLKAISETNHKLEIEKQKEKSIAESKQKNIIMGFVILVLLIVAFFSRAFYKRYKHSEEQNHIIEKQKHEVELQKNVIEEKQKEILDSFHYADRIQRSLLPSEKFIEKHLRRKG